MTSTQPRIFLTATQEEQLNILASTEGRSIGELTHEAIDAYIASVPPALQAALDATFGVAPSFRVPSRTESNRSG